VVTNFAVWTGGWYGYTLEGLITCYIMAIPFFVNMLLSTLIFSEMFKYFQKHTFVIPQIKFA